MADSNLQLVFDSRSSRGSFQSDPNEWIIADTRVMSPTQANSGLLSGLQCKCPMCHTMTSEPTVCANCGTYGHAVCLGLQHFEGYTFCGPCMINVTAQYVAIKDANQKLEWHLKATDQLRTWKTRAREAIGVSTSIGLAVGGAAAAATGAVVAAAQGLVQEHNQLLLINLFRLLHSRIPLRREL